MICLYGVTGSGKTRMLQLMEKQLPESSRLRVGIETFHDDYVAAARAGSMDIMSKYQNVSNLFLDNLWLLLRRPALLSVICELLQQRRVAGRMTVVTSDLDLEAWQNHSPQLAAILSEAETFRMQQTAPSGAKKLPPVQTKMATPPILPQGRHF